MYTPSRTASFFILLSSFLASAVNAQNIVLTNDDGWATAQIREQYQSLKDAQYDVILSAPALDNSGTGSLSLPIIPPVLIPCEFNSCAIGSPGKGVDSVDPHINYVNGFPVDAARHGIETLAPKFFGKKPDLVVSGPNIGGNDGLEVLISGTVGAAVEGEKQGVPSLAFSGVTNTRVSYKTLQSEPNSPGTLSAITYADLTTHFVQTLLKGTPSGQRLVPNGAIINTNYPALSFALGSKCSKPEDIKWVFSRLFQANDIFDHDIDTGCGTGNKLPDGKAVVESEGCFASVVVLNSGTKLQAGEDAQTAVFKSLSGLGWTCWAESK
ncbi:sure-like protein [Cristinia sonorae]|uniref:Sure-like protein n=1 Tax=Cristinia sonorae TaxID=1940300 RepID=A0A8K0XR26_9AGAR|nr:sure-like protein [Cristinia sonorae]